MLYFPWLAFDATGSNKEKKMSSEETESVKEARSENIASVTFGETSLPVFGCPHDTSCLCADSASWQLLRSSDMKKDFFSLFEWRTTECGFTHEISSVPEISCPHSALQFSHSYNDRLEIEMFRHMHIFFQIRNQHACRSAAAVCVADVFFSISHTNWDSEHYLLY